MAFTYRSLQGIGKLGEVSPGIKVREGGRVTHVTHFTKAVVKQICAGSV